jgi:DNA replication and repair protein RecF
VRVISAELRDFRTYTRAEVWLGPGLTVVHGPNGVGKSNLLEAIYFGCTGHALRTHNERELIRFGEHATRVLVRVADERDQHELSIGFGTDPDNDRPIKRMWADGAPVERLLDLDIRPLVSVFLPDRLELLKGPPALRRSHLDQLIVAIWPSRRETRRAYARALAQRSALIAGIRAGRSSRATLPTWDRELARHAIALHDHRAEVLALLAGPFAQRARELGLDGESTLEYRPRSRAADPEQFVAELQERLPGDLARGFSGHGPHRDELAILRDGRELRSFGSQGEQRLALLALLLAERAVLLERRGRLPLMLLDDVMSELDRHRRELLTGELSTGGQSLITTTDLAHVPGAQDARVTRLRVSPGGVAQEHLAA